MVHIVPILVQENALENVLPHVRVLVLPGVLEIVSSFARVLAPEVAHVLVQVIAVEVVATIVVVLVADAKGVVQIVTKNEYACICNM